MAIHGKHISLTLVAIILTTSLLIVKPVNCQSTPTIPTLTLKLVDYMEGGGLEITVQNQPVIPNGHDSAWIFFDFKYKWHESAEWYHTEPDTTKWERQYIGERDATGTSRMVGSPNSYYQILGDTSSHQLDYQVRAINGYLDESVPFAPPIGIDPNDTPVVVVNTSEWSDTFTITLPDYKPLDSTPTPITTATPSTPNTSTVSYIPSNDITTIKIILGVIATSLIVIAVLLFLLLKGKTHKTSKNPEA